MKQLRLDQWTRIHDKVLIIGGLWDGKGKRPYALSLPEEPTVNEAQQIEEAKAKIDANLSNYVTEISSLSINNVNKQEAESILQENIKINSLVFDATKHMQQEEGSENSDNSEKK